MGEWREIGTIVRLSAADISVWAVTFALTVLADLTVTVEVGMVLAALLYIYRISQTTTVAPVTKEFIRDGQPHVLQDKEVPWYVAILHIYGPFLFRTTEKLAEVTTDLNRARCDRAALARNIRKATTKVGQDTAAVRSARSAGRAATQD
jgi:SulP family sulfate permease